jgi:FAD/FMN-containing dehydrogenase
LFFFRLAAGLMLARDSTQDFREEPAMTRDVLDVDLPGDIVHPQDSDYDTARAVFNSMIDRRPLAVVRCRETADVIRGVVFAAEHDLPLAIRGGGHNVAGYAVCDGGIMLDLSPMKGLRVDPQRRIAQAGPGLTLGELDRGTQQHGLATPLGVVSMTGVAGLTLGGGLGWLNGKYGLACDNLLAAEVVTADGEVLRASADQNADLFWGLRGGGGNFGVVTSFTYRLHPVGPVLAGGLCYPWARADEALRCHHEFVAAAPDELSTAVSLGLDPDSGEPLVTVAVCYCGSLEEGQRILRPLRAFGPPVADTIAVMPYVTWQSAPDAGFPSGRLHYWKAGWLRQLTPAAIETIMRFVPPMPSAASGVGLQRMGGAASRVAPSETAFAQRAEQYDFLILSQWGDPRDSERNLEWTRALFAAMQPHLESAAYVNNLGAEGADRVRAAYGENYSRLARVKRAYDPRNVFRLNQNIIPAT